MDYFGYYAEDFYTHFCLLRTGSFECSATVIDACFAKLLHSDIEAQRAVRAGTIHSPTALHCAFEALQFLFLRVNTYSMLS